MSHVLPVSWQLIVGHLGRFVLPVVDGMTFLVDEYQGANDTLGQDRQKEPSEDREMS